MKKFTSYAVWCLSLIAVMTMIGSSTASAQVPIKRVLVEEGTGAWCGYCPRGATTLLNTIEKYPDKVIGVAVHNADGMTIPEEAAYSTAYMNGFPCMTIDRKRHNVSGAKPGVNDGAIVGPIQNQMVVPAKVAVSIENLVYSSSNRTLTVDVKAAFVSNVIGDIRFNLYIVEDSVKGSGTGWDQNNYMSKTGADPDPNSPWYNLPPKLTNFYHRHVLRAMLGGTWGDAGVIPDPVQSGGTYTKSYTYKVPNNFNTDRIHLVGIVQMYNSSVDKREVLNAIQQGLFETKLPSVVVTGNVTEPYLRAGTSATISKKVTFSNSNATDVTVDIGLDTENSSIPDGWVTKVEPTTATIPAGGTFDATVSIETDGNFDFAKAVVTATPVVQDAIPVAGTATVYALSEGIKYAVIEGFNPLALPFSSAFKSLDIIGDQTKVFVWGTDRQVLEAYVDQFNVVAMSFSGGLIYNQGLTLLTGTPIAADETANPDYPNMAKFIKTVMSAGKRVLVSVPNGLALNKLAGATNQDATDFYAMLGVELSKQNQHYTVAGTNYTPTQYTVSGIANEICAGITATGNTNLNAGYAFYTNSMKLSPGSKSVPIFSMSGSPADILGVRYEAANNARVVFLTFDMAAFGNGAIDRQIMDKSVNWLAEGLIVKPKLPVISTINDVDFGEVELKKSYDMTIEIKNEGEADLEVTKIEINGIGSKDFKVKSMSLPMTIKAGEKVVVTITYTPSVVGDVSATLSVTSNDPKSGTINAELVGKGKEPAVSVFTPADQARTITGLTAGPNPAISKSTINYTISGVAPQVVEIYMVDMRGARVATLVDNLMQAPGSYNVNVNAADLASGSYRVVAHTAVETVQLPLVINR